MRKLTLPKGVSNNFPRKWSEYESLIKDFILNLIKSTFTIEILCFSIYWDITIASALAFPWLSHQTFWSHLTIGIIVGGSSIIFLPIVIAYSKKLSSKELLIALSTLPAFGILICIAWTTNSLNLINVILVIWAAFFIGIFNFVLGFEEFNQLNRDSIPLAHSRYLEYGRSVTWVVIFTVASLVIAEINIFGKQEILNTWNQSTYQILHLGTGFGFGICLVFWAFHRRLCQIERMMD